MFIGEWRKRLAYAPEDAVHKTFMTTTQTVMNVEAENRMSGRRHYKSRFAFLKEKKINDVFYSDIFFLPLIQIMEIHVANCLLGRKPIL